MLKVTENGETSNVVTAVAGGKSGDAVTTKAIKLGANYKLVYRNGLSKKSAERVISLSQFQQGFETLQQCIKDQGMTEGYYRSAVLTPIVEAWGRRSLGLPLSEHIDPTPKKIVQKAFMHSKKDKERMNSFLDMYMALHIGSYEDAYTMIVNDGAMQTPTLETYNSSADWVRESKTYEEFCETFKQAGAFIVEFPKKENLAST